MILYLTIKIITTEFLSSQHPVFFCLRFKVIWFLFRCGFPADLTNSFTVKKIHD